MSSKEEILRVERDRMCLTKYKHRKLSGILIGADWFDPGDVRGYGRVWGDVVGVHHLRDRKRTIKRGASLRHSTLSGRSEVES